MEFISEKQKYILEVAETVFVKYGFRETTIRKVTAEARVNRAMLHYYFHSKEQLIKKMLSRKIDKLNVAFSERFSGSKSNGMDDIISIYVDIMIENKAFYCLLYSELLKDHQDAVHKSIVSFFNTARQKMKIVLEQSTSYKTKNNQDVEIKILSFFGTLMNTLAVLGLEDEATLKLRLLNHFNKSFK